MSWENVRLRVEAEVATITLDRPQALNAFAGTMREDLREAILEAAKSARVLVVVGAGRAFSSGGDVSIMATADRARIASLVEQGKRVVSALRDLPIPSLACVNGVAAGAGLGLALACDLRIASSSARLGATFARIGLHPDWGVSYALTRLAGPAVARDLVFSGRLVPAEEARELGLVNWVVSPEELEERTREKAEVLRDAAPLAIRWAKRTLARAEDASLDEVLDLEAEAQLACFDTEDAREGLRAFRRKSRPEFKGR